METMKRELKDAFRYRSHLGYGADGDGSGYIVIGGDNFLGNFVMHCIDMIFTICCCCCFLCVPHSESH